MSYVRSELRDLEDRTRRRRRFLVSGPSSCGPHPTLEFHLGAEGKEATASIKKIGLPLLYYCLEQLQPYPRSTR
jgi:hypothetical protein